MFLFSTPSMAPVEHSAPCIEMTMSILFCCNIRQSVYYLHARFFHPYPCNLITMSALILRHCMELQSMSYNMAEQGLSHKKG
jgi:hypothetical protein